LSAEHCYHCGLPIPAGVDLPVDIDGAARAMCCGGCQAVARAIVEGGLADYYRNRDALPESPREALPKALDDLRLFDHAAVQKSFVRTLDADEREVSLILEGITCAACIWLNEQHLATLPGVTGVAINYATRRARVRWDARRCQLSDILAAVAAIGYRAHPYDVSRHEVLARKERRDALWRVFVAGFGAMQIMMYAVPVYLAGEGEMSSDIEQLMRWASLVLTLPVVFYSAAHFFRNAWRDLRLRRAGMDVPVALGVAVAFVASVWATLTAGGEVYFDSVSMFVFLLLGGRYLEMQARQKAVAATETLARLVPAVATRLAAWPGDLVGESLAAAELQAGDHVLVKAGETVPADGVVVHGASSVDESLLTGESQPVRRGAGEAVTAGTINGDGPLVVRVEQAGEATRLSAILRLMERAASERPRLVEMADKVAARFVVAILGIALLVAAGWWWVDPAKAIWVSVAVLVVTCPCALSLATPIALTVANGALARSGLLVSRGHAVETLARADRLVFDKTGTLTEGRLRLVEVRPVGGLDAAACRALAGSLETVSEHPLARALRGDAPPDSRLALTDFVVAPGEGVAGNLGGRRCRIGRPEYVAALHGQAVPEIAAALAAAGGSVVALGDADGWLAFFRLEDRLRPGARAMVASLRALGVEVAILSGDAPAAVGRVAAELGIADWSAGLLPQDKLARVTAWQAGGEVVAMVGDGINDAPVLSQAQVSIAMGQGANLAKVQADCVLLGDDLGALTTAIALARRTLVVIRENLGWSVLYNVVAVPLAAAGWVTPWLAGVGMSGSSLLVVLNALRLRARR